MSVGDAARPHSIAFLLVPGFPLMSYASVGEPFRAANVIARRKLYDFHDISLDGAPVSMRHGGSMTVDASVADDVKFDAIFVLAGGDCFTIEGRKMFAWLRSQGRSAVRIAGISGGAVILARAGLLDGYRATVHWEIREMFHEEFPRVILETGLYVIDRKRMTCAGAISGLDFAIGLIERDHGSTLASKVSDTFIRTDPRAGDRPQRMTLRERYGASDDRILRVLAQMEENVEEPLEREALGSLSGVSLRQMERLFQSQLGKTIDQAYLDIRLDKALQLLRSTSMSVMEVAIASGFASSSHFSRRFGQRYSTTPRAARSDMQNPVRTDNPAESGSLLSTPDRP